MPCSDGQDLLVEVIARRCGELDQEVEAAVDWIGSAPDYVIVQSQAQYGLDKA